MSIEIDASALNGRLVALVKETKVELKTAILKAGRQLSVALAKATQPFGFGEEAKKREEDRIARDIRRVYPSPEAKSIAATIRAIARKNDKNNAVVRFERYLATDNEAASDDMLRDMKFQGYGKTPDLALYRARWQGGKLHRGKSQIVLNQKLVETLIRKKQALVGFAASGWAACARALGAARYIPLWKKRGKAPGHVVDRTDDEKPSLTLSNDIAYTGRVLSETGKKQAIAEAFFRLKADLEIRLKHRK